MGGWRTLGALWSGAWIDAFRHVGKDTPLFRASHIATPSPQEEFTC